MIAALADDGNHNVQAEAITGLAQLRGHASDALYVSALNSTGHQVIMAAASALTACWTVSSSRAPASPFSVDNSS